jgi:uncharacterized protein YjbJ (UPF0337 family)
MIGSDQLGETMAFMDTLKKWFGSAKEQAGEMADKAKPMMEKAGEKAKPMMEKAGDVAEKAWEKTKDVAEDIKDRFDGDEEGGEPEAPSAPEAPPSGM